MDEVVPSTDYEEQQDAPPITRAGGYRAPDHPMTPLGDYERTYFPDHVLTLTRDSEQPYYPDRPMIESGLSEQPYYPVPIMMDAGPFEQLDVYLPGPVDHRIGLLLLHI
ncbi:hypothetical protein Droror1_Dr00012320 [Drosera rotundifolia]